MGSLTGTLSYSDQPLWMIDVPIGLSELVPMAVLANMAWGGLVQPLLLGFWNGVRSCFGSGLEASTIEAAGEAASAAAEEAAIDGVIVEDAVVSMTVGATALAGFIVLAAIPLILALLAHPSYHTLKIYNLTPYNITWHDPYFSEGVMNMAPVQGMGAGFNYAIPAQSLYNGKRENRHSSALNAFASSQSMRLREPARLSSTDLLVNTRGETPVSYRPLACPGCRPEYLW